MTYNPRTGEFLVNTNTAGAQFQPFVTVLESGRFLVVWSGPTAESGGQFALRGQLFEADGARVGSEILLSDLTAAGQFQPAVTALPDGGFAIAWLEGADNPRTLKAQFFDSAGVETSIQYIVDGGDVLDPAVASLGDGRVALVWWDRDPGVADGSGTGLRGMIIDPDEDVFTFMEFPVATTTTGNQSVPSITAFDNGRFVVSWTDQSGVGGDPTEAIKAQLFTSDGFRIGGELLVNTTTNLTQTDSVLATLESGGFVAIWTDASGSGDTSGLGLRGQVFQANGVKLGAEFRVNTETAGDQRFPSVTSTEDGGFLVTWTDAGGSGGQPGIATVKAQQFAADGTKVGGEFLVNVVTTGTTGSANAAATGTGDVLVAWTDTSGVGGDPDQAIKARLFTQASFATEGNDTLSGTAGNDHILALGGDDTLFFQQGGNDIVDGGAGRDLFFLGGAFNDADIMEGGVNPDILVLQGRYDILSFGPLTMTDIETVVLWTYSNHTFGGALGNFATYRLVTDDATVAAGSTLTVDGRQLVNPERLSFDGSAETNGNFYLYGGAAGDELIGGAGNDTIDGGAGHDGMSGGGGNDRYFVDHVSDVVIEAVGEGFDSVYTRVNLTLRFGSEVEFLAANGLAPGAGIQLIGNDFGQTIIGASGNDTLHGLAGNDFLTGNAGNDGLDGGSGLDVMNGGTGNDVYFVDQSGDVVQEAAGGGFDAVYSRASYTLRAGVEVEQLATTGLNGDQQIVLRGNEFGQSITGFTANDSLFGGGGNDFLNGGEGNDTLVGGTGADVMNGGVGNDVYFVDQAGDAVQDSAGSGGFDAVYTAVTYQLSGGAEVELLATTGLAPGQAITLFGNGFAQSVIGGTGDDTLYGFGGNDSLVGNEGNDTIDGGAGDDGLRGGAGADVFQFTAVSDSTGAGDNIFDFVSGTDTIDLSLIDANTDVDGNHAFTFIGTNAFSGTAGELRVESNGGLVNVLGDVDGDGVADLIIHLYNTGGVTPVAGDFLL